MQDDLTAECISSARWIILLIFLFWKYSALHGSARIAWNTLPSFTTLFMLQWSRFWLRILRYVLCKISFYMHVYPLPFERSVKSWWFKVCHFSSICRPMSFCNLITLSVTFYLTSVQDTSFDEFDIRIFWAKHFQMIPTLTTLWPLT